jgi:hypothetical protein
MVQSYFASTPTYHRFPSKNEKNNPTNGRIVWACQAGLFAVGRSSVGRMATGNMQQVWVHMNCVFACVACAGCQDGIGVGQGNALAFANRFGRCVESRMR